MQWANEYSVTGKSSSESEAQPIERSKIQQWAEIIPKNFFSRRYKKK